MVAHIVNKEAKKREILRAAMKVFAQNGVVNTKMADIAEAAGIGKGTIYEYFRSKEDIFAEAYTRIFQGTEERIGRLLESGAEPEEKLRRLMMITIEGFFSDGGEFAGIMMAFWSEGIRNKDERIIEIINLQQAYSQYRGMLSGILEEGIRKRVFRKMDTLLTASVLIGAMDGILLQCIMDPKIFRPERAAEVMLDSYLNGIKK